MECQAYGRKSTRHAVRRVAIVSAGRKCGATCRRATRAGVDFASDRPIFIVCGLSYRRSRTILDSSRVLVMTLASPSNQELRATIASARRYAPRRGSVRSWTGRSALSNATTSPLSRITTSGSYKTRVSALRDVAGPWGSRRSENPLHGG